MFVLLTVPHNIIVIQLLCLVKLCSHRHFLMLSVSHNLLLRLNTPRKCFTVIPLIPPHIILCFYFLPPASYLKSLDSFYVIIIFFYYIQNINNIHLLFNTLSVVGEQVVPKIACATCKECTCGFAYCVIFGRKILVSCLWWLRLIDGIVCPGTLMPVTVQVAHLIYCVKYWKQKLYIKTTIYSQRLGKVGAYYVSGRVHKT